MRARGNTLSFKPDPKPLPSGKRRKLSKAETDAQIAWKIVPPGCDPHHVVYAQTLRHHGLADHEWNIRNRMVLTRERHAEHHSGERPIPKSGLPREALDFAKQHGLMEWIDQHYPSGDLGKILADVATVTAETDLVYIGPSRVPIAKRGGYQPEASGPPPTQPPPKRTDLAPTLAIGQPCPTCKQKVRPPRIKSAEPKHRATVGIAVPMDERENGAQMLKEKFEMCARDPRMAELGYDESTPPYYVLSALLPDWCASGQYVAALEAEVERLSREAA